MSESRVTRNCQKCGCLLKNHQRKFCSNQCQKDYEWEVVKTRINSTQQFPCYKWRSNIPKRYLLEAHGHRCQICRQTIWREQPIPLEVDHIDGNHLNNHITNFRLICPNCGAQLPTYKGKNRGQGRQQRRERYQNGQSY